MKIITIGTSLITRDFIKTAQEIDDVEIIGTYSREISKAQEFSKELGIREAFNSFQSILKNEQVNTIYIASPNALHYKQAKFFLENGKNVIVEKPLTSELSRAKELFDLAKKNELFIFEAISNVHTPNFSIFKEYILKLGEIRLVQASFSQYSSRYQLFKDGKRPNVFNPDFSGGALMDLNVYNIHLICSLFGKPRKINYFPNIVDHIDTSGVMVMDYENFKAVSVAAKDSEAMSYFQVQGDKGYIIAKGSNHKLNSIYIKIGDQEQSFDYNTKPRLYSEIVKFSELYKNKNYKESYTLFENSLIVVEILEKAWSQNNLNFKDQI